MSFLDEERRFLQQARLTVRIPADAIESNQPERGTNSDDVTPLDLEAEERDILFFGKQIHGRWREVCLTHIQPR